jgi:UDP-3-O-[3-hydroxymyristoyl] glucosamine N-acyltransferase
MKKTVAEIAQLLDGRVVGNGEAQIEGVAGIEDAGQGEITFLESKKLSSFLQTTAASAIIVPQGTTSEGQTLICVEQPRLAFAKVMRLFYPSVPQAPHGIHPTAAIEKEVQLGNDVSIGAHVSIGAGAVIGDRAVLFPGVVVGPDSRIGHGTVIHANVTIREGVTIGADCIIHSGTVIGSDGFGYAQDDQGHLKIPQVGTVIVEDDVEIGANVTIDRGTLGATRIGHGVKIDNLVQIAHNVVIGPNSLLISQVGISGSTELGEGVILAGQVGVVGHIKIGDRSVVGAKSGVSKSIPSENVMFGIPARPINKSKRIEACLSRLPDLFKRVKELEKDQAPPSKEGE